MPDQTSAPGARIEPLDRDALRAAIHTGGLPVVPADVRAAIHAGHIGQVVIFCDGCGVQEVGDYTGETREVRFAAARDWLASMKGWRTGTLDLCPTCSAIPPSPPAPRAGVGDVMTCPRCGNDDCWREEADVGIGILYGPWGCPCGWSESSLYDVSAGPKWEGSYRVDQWGGLTLDGTAPGPGNPKESADA